MPKCVTCTEYANFFDVPMEPGIVGVSFPKPQSWNCKKKLNDPNQNILREQVIFGPVFFISILQMSADMYDIEIQEFFPKGQVFSGYIGRHNCNLYSISITPKN